jgi:hypothetical protein
MGINLESVLLLHELAKKGLLAKGRVLELGLQDMFIPSEKLSKLLNTERSITSSSELFSFFGFENHLSIDGHKTANCYPLDLNYEIDSEILTKLKSELVTNFGTSEHIFNQMNVFRNIHNFCTKEGVMIHAVPILGNAQHGYFNYQPRMFFEMAAANNYGILAMYLAPNYWPTLIPYSRQNLYKNRFKDVMLLVAFKKTNDEPFAIPFDGLFGNEAKVYGYSTESTFGSDLSNQFESFLVSGSWSNLNSTRFEVFSKRTKSVLTRFGIRTRFRRLFQKS